MVLLPLIIDYPFFKILIRKLLKMKNNGEINFLFFLSGIQFNYLKFRNKFQITYFIFQSSHT